MCPPSAQCPPPVPRPAHHPHPNTRTRRSRDGSVISYPVVETIHKDSICHVTEAPADAPVKVCAGHAGLCVGGASTYGLACRSARTGMHSCVVLWGAVTGARQLCGPPLIAPFTSGLLHNAWHVSPGCKPTHSLRTRVIMHAHTPRSTSRPLRSLPSARWRAWRVRASSGAWVCVCVAGGRPLWLTPACVSPLQTLGRQLRAA